jgi:hypothetical protein
VELKNDYIMARWEGEAEQALKKAGYTVVARDGVSDYQGWGVMLGKSESGMFAVLSWSYGSCGGCDPYDGDSTTQIVESLAGTIEHFSTDEAGAVERFKGSKGW